MNKVLTKTMTLLALGAVSSCVTNETEKPRPNIILIMSDDQGFETLGSYGGESYETPVLDKLAETGIRFDQAHATDINSTGTADFLIYIRIYWNRTLCQSVNLITYRKRYRKRYRKNFRESLISIPDKVFIDDF